MNNFQSSMKTGLLPINVGVMLKGRGINFISKEDY